MIALYLSIAMSACQGYAERLPYADPDILATYYAACSEALEADGGGVMQVSSCVIEKDGSGMCDFWQYGRRRLPFEP